MAIELTFPNDGLRTRKVVTRSRGRATGKYPSWKMQRMVQWESPNELNAFRLLDANPAVTAYKEQPVIIDYDLDGERRRHYPDTLVELQDGSKELWEIKPASKAQRPDCVARTELLAAELPKLGYRYCLAIAEDLARQPRLDNALSLLKFGRRPANPLVWEHLRQAASDSGSLPWATIVGGRFGPAGRYAACRLVLEGVMSFDIEGPWTPDTTFYWGDTPVIVREY